MQHTNTNVHISADAIEAHQANKPYVKVTLTDHNSGSLEPLGSFYIPMSTYKAGRTPFVAAVKFRAKHDLDITNGHYSSHGW